MKTLSNRLLLSATLALAAFPHRAEGEDPDKVARNLQGQLSKHNGDAMALAATLLGENATYRDRVRTLEGEVAQAKLPDGAVVLTKEQAAQWTEYQALGAPAEVKTKVESGTQASEKLAGFERREQLRGVAERVGYKPGVLEKLGGDLTFEELEVDGEKEGEKVKTYGVKGADGKVQPLTEYAKANWGDFLPALSAQGGEQQQEQQRTITPRVPLGGAGAAATGGRTTEQIAAEKRQSGEYSF